MLFFDRRFVSYVVQVEADRLAESIEEQVETQDLRAFDVR